MRVQALGAIADVNGASLQRHTDSEPLHIWRGAASRVQLPCAGAPLTLHVTKPGMPLPVVWATARRGSKANNLSGPPHTNSLATHQSCVPAPDQAWKLPGPAESYSAKPENHGVPRAT
jgi:hypothetical protein